MAILIAVVGQKSFAQPQEYKAQLFDQGIERLRTQKKIEFTDLINVFEAAVFNDFDKRIDGLIEEFCFRRSFLLDFADECSEIVPNYDFVFRNLRTGDLYKNDTFRIANFAFKLGARNDDLTRLVNMARDLLQSRITEDEFFAGPEEDRANEIELRLDELQYAWQLGRLLQNEVQLDLRQVQKNVKTPQLRENLHAVWLVEIGYKTLTLEQVAESIEGIESLELSNLVLVNLLSKLDTTRLDSKVGRQLAEKLLVSQVDFEYENNFYDQDWRLFEVDEHLFPFEEDLPPSNPSRIIAICNRSKRFQDDVELLKFVAKVGKTHVARPPIEKLRPWISASINARLASGEIAKAKVVGEKYSIELHPSTVLVHLLKQKQFEAAIQLCDTTKKNANLTRLVASALLSAGRNEEARPYVEQLEKKFVKEFEKQQGDRTNWLIKIAMVEGWSIRGIDCDQLVLDQAILNAFEQEERTGDEGELIANALGSFTPPTGASRTLLSKMMAMLPESERVSTQIGLEELVADIRSATDEEVGALLLKAIDFVKVARGSKNEFSGRLAFEFAKVGSRIGVQGMLNQISNEDDKTWTLFHCAKVFPPSDASLTVPDYSPRRVGGVF